MSGVATVADLGPQHLEQEVRVAAQGHQYGALSGRLGLVVQMDELTCVALWRGDKCVQVTIPSVTEAQLKVALP